MASKGLKVAGVLGGVLLLLVAFGGESKAAVPPNPNPPEPNPPNPKPPGPKPPGPHPPPWDPAVAVTHTVQVPGGYTGMRVRTGPSTKNALLVAEDFVPNGSKVGVLEEIGTDTEGTWAHIYTPNGWEGWMRSVDTAGNRNIFFEGQIRGGRVTGPPDGIDAVSPAEFAKMAGRPAVYQRTWYEQRQPLHGWYPYEDAAYRRSNDPSTFANVANVNGPRGFIDAYEDAAYRRSNDPSTFANVANVNGPRGFIDAYEDAARRRNPPQRYTRYGDDIVGRNAGGGPRGFTFRPR